MRVALPELVEHRRVGQLDGVARAGLGQAPAVEHDQADARPRLTAPAARHDPREALGVEARAAHQRAVDVRLGEDLRRVVGLDAAAVEHADRARPPPASGRHQRAHEGDRLLGDLGRGDLAGADRPDRLVGDHHVGEPLGRDLLEPLLHLVAQLALGLAALALLLGLAHAQDRAQAAPSAAGTFSCSARSVSP